MPQSQAIHVSVVVPCRNEIRHIRAFLDSVLRQELGRIEMEVLIADGMSDDGTRLVLDEFERKFAAIRVLDNPEKIASTGLNRAIREARGEIIIRMDAHTTYAAGLRAFLRRSAPGNQCRQCGWPGIDARGRVYCAGHRVCLPHALCHRRRQVSRSAIQGPADTVMYGCWRKSTLERIGLFDEKLVRGQDYELNARLLSCGGTLWQSPKITFWYRPRASLSGLFRQYFQYGFWKVAVVRKHGRLASWRNFVPGSCLLAGVVLLLCAAAASLGGLTWWRDMFLVDWFTLAASYFIASFATRFSVAKRQGWSFFSLLACRFCRLPFLLRARFCSGPVVSSRDRGPPKSHSESSYGHHQIIFNPRPFAPVST